MAISDIDGAQTCEGGGEGKLNIRKWLKDVVKSPEIEGDVSLELWNVGQGADGAIHSTEWDITEPMDDVIDELMDHAEEDALNVGRGSIRFKVVVTDRKKFGRAAFTLRVPNNDFDTDDMEDIEELATHKGVLTQLMRHQEKTMKVGLGGSDKVMAHMSRMLDTAHKRIAELEGQYMNNAKTYEELLSGKHIRDLELRKLTNSERRNEQVAGMLLQGVPLLLNRFLAGKPQELPPGPSGAMPPQDKPFNEPVTPLEHMLEGFLQSFTPPQLQAIMQSGIFTPSQMMTFVEIAKVVQARMEAREAAANGQGTPTGGQGTPTGGQ